MFDNFDMSQMTKMLEKAQQEAQKLQEDLESKEYVAKSGGGLVKVTINGKGEVIDIDIDDSLLEDKDSMQILLISAVNDALKMADSDKKTMASQMFTKMGGFGK